MKKTIILILMTIFMVSCKEAVKNKVIEDSEEVGILTKEVVHGPYSNPVFIYGSDFGSFFQSLYKLGDFDKMMSFTSSQSLSIHGPGAIRKKYETMDFGFSLNLKSKVDNDDGSTILNYQSQKFATKHYTRIRVIIENDSVKLVLPERLNNLFTTVP